MTQVTQKVDVGQATVLLQIRDSTGVRARAPLAGKRFLIGRDTECHVRLRGEGVSRKHAELFRDKKGNWWVRDLGSSNGTRINGKRIDEHMIDMLADRIQVGHYRLKLIDLAETDSSAGASAKSTTQEKVSPAAEPAASQVKTPQKPDAKPDAKQPQSSGDSVTDDSASSSQGFDPDAATLASSEQPDQWTSDDITIANEPSLIGLPANELSGTGAHMSATGVGSHSGTSSGSVSGGGSVSSEFAAPEPVGEADENELTVPKKLGGYEVLNELGRGGMGAVYLARQLSLNRRVALKVMNKQWAANAEFLAGFMREAYAAAQLVHHNITQIYDIGADKGLNFFSMEFIDGNTLGQMMRDTGGLDPHDAVGYIIQAAHGLKYAHDNGMIHRDIKPDNLLINDQDVVKVNDLGLVKTPESQSDHADDDHGDLTERHVRQAMGTPAYMAPEQARNAATADERSDVYSLGCTMYRMITARPLFAGSSPLEMMNKHVSEQVDPSRLIDDGIPDWLIDCLMTMIAKDPDHRQQSMSDVIDQLQQALSNQTGQPTPGKHTDYQKKSKSPAAVPHTNSPEDSLSLPGLVEDTAPPVPATRPKPPPTKSTAPATPTKPANTPPPPPPPVEQPTIALNTPDEVDDDQPDLGDLFADIETSGQIAQLPVSLPDEQDDQEGGLPKYILWIIIGLAILVVVIWTIAAVLLTKDGEAETELSAITTLCNHLLIFISPF